MSRFYIVVSFLLFACFSMLLLIGSNIALFRKWISNLEQKVRLPEQLMFYRICRVTILMKIFSKYVLVCRLFDSCSIAKATSFISIFQSILQLQLYFQWFQSHSFQMDHKVFQPASIWYRLFAGEFYHYNSKA